MFPTISITYITKLNKRFLGKIFLVRTRNEYTKILNDLCLLVIIDGLFSASLEMLLPNFLIIFMFFIIIRKRIKSEEKIDN